MCPVLLAALASTVVTGPSLGHALESGQLHGVGEEERGRSARGGLRSALQEFPPTVVWKNTTLDWFRYTPDAGSPTVFRQRLLIFDGFWNRSTGPILMFFGGEGRCEDFYDNSGALFELAPKLGALVIFLEHRYYGDSLPFPTAAESYSNEGLRYLTVEQALADMSDVLSLKQSLLNCSDDLLSCPVVLFGGSYGGMQAAWHRLKYPHLSVGALAASAPVDIYPGEAKSAAFWNATLYTYQTYGGDEGGCAQWVSAAVVRLSAPGVDRQLLTSTFMTCAPVVSDNDVARLQLYIQGALATEAMVDYPYASTFVTPMPANPVKFACSKTAGTRPTSVDALLFESLNTIQNVFLNYTAELKCHNISAELLRFKSSPHTSSGRIKPMSMPSQGAKAAPLGDIGRPWNYMACSSLILEPLTSDGDGFFVPREDQIPEIEAACRRSFSRVTPRIHWTERSYGNGIQLARNLRNVLFSDGDKDPWRVGGMPENTSAYSLDHSVSRLLIREAAHHQDLRFADAADSRELIAARATEARAIRGWLGLA
eukprot:m.96299 g.96299  ORF g.96299 m.96299 type:complete len:540 (-) comp20459_c1_seq3:129-1748(-)